MNNRKQQSGVMLLEALIAILIFSMGILAIVGLQAAAIKASGDAKYRTDASLLTNELIGRMWTADRSGVKLQSEFQGGSGTDGLLYKDWHDKVVLVLPDAAATVAVIPGVVGDAITPKTSSVVTVTIRWKAPNDAAQHNYSAIARII